jgi:hypothetical protein
MQLYLYFMSQSNEFCRYNPLCCFSTSVYCCLFRYRHSPETFGYTVIYLHIFYVQMIFPYVGLHHSAGKMRPHALRPTWPEWPHFSVTTGIAGFLWCHPQRSVNEPFAYWLHTTRCISQDGMTSSRLCVDFQRPRTSYSGCSGTHLGGHPKHRESKLVGYCCTNCKKFKQNSGLPGLFAAVSIRATWIL